MTSSGVAWHSEEKSGESWIWEGKGPQQLDQVPLSPPALHIQDGTDLDKEGGVEAFASLSCGTHFPLCSGGCQTAASGWGGRTWTPSPTRSSRGPGLFPSPGGGAVSSLPWPQAGLASNSSVSCCQGCQDVTSGRWVSDQWTPSLSKDGGAGSRTGEQLLMDGPRNSDGWAGRSCHLSWGSE